MGIEQHLSGDIIDGLYNAPNPITAVNPAASVADAAAAVAVLGNPVFATTGGTGQSVYAIGDLLFANTTTSLAKLADVAAGRYLRSGGVGVAPLWSTLILPNAATTGDILIASAANTITSLADVAVGSYLRSGGVGVVPLWSTLTLPNAAVKGDIFSATAANTGATLAVGTAGQSLTPNAADATGLRWVTPGLAQSSPADPGTTTSLVGVMMGLAGTITPTKSGRILIIISGDVDNNANGNGAQVQIRTGTGAAPANGAALTGTARGGLVKFFENNLNARVGWSLNCAIAGLAVGTAVWIDISLASITGGTSRVRDISISAIEQ